MTVYEFHQKLKKDSAVQSYLEFLKDTVGSSYLNAYFEDGGKHYPSYPLPEFKYHNVKGFLKPIYWGGDYKGNMIKHLFGTTEIFDGYTIFGEYTGSISMGNYGSGQGFIRPYMKSKDSDYDDMWRYVVSLRTASKLLDGKNWSPTNFDSRMSFYHYLSLNNKGARQIQKESAQILGQKFREIQLAIEEDDAYREWRDNGGIIAKDVKVEFNLKEVYNELKSKIRPGLQLDNEDKDQLQCSIRNWGQWEHDYEDYDRDESDFEDDDYMILTDKSREALVKIIDEIKEKYPQVSIEWNTSEKNWIDFSIDRITYESVESVDEKVKLIMKNILSKMVPAAFGASTDPKMRDEIKNAVQSAIEPILKKYDYIVEDVDHEVGMAQGQLDSIHKDASDLQEKIGTEEKDIPAWIQSHITSAYEYLKQANDNYHELEEPTNESYIIGDYDINWSINNGITKETSGKIIAIAASGKDVDSLIASGYSNTQIGKDLEDGINDRLKKLKQAITVQIDWGYKGAGYAFDVDFSKVLKGLR